MEKKSFYTEIRLKHKTLEEKIYFEKELDCLLKANGYTNRNEFFRECIRKLQDKRTTENYNEQVATEITGLNAKYSNGKLILEDGSQVLIMNSKCVWRMVIATDSVNIIEYKVNNGVWESSTKELSKSTKTKGED